MSDFSKLNGYNVKDAQARLDIAEMKHPGELDVHYLTASNSSNIYGDCIAIHGDVTGVIDLGYDSSLQALLEYLSDNDITKLDFVIITHYHADHITSDFSTAIDTLRTNRIDLSNCVFYLPHKGINWSRFIGDEENWSDRETAVINKLNGLGISYLYPNNEQTIELNDHTSLSFYNIGDYDGYYDYTMSQEQNDLGHTNYNIFSMITMLKHYNNSFLFTSDALYPALERNAQYIKECDVYKIEHHSLELVSSASWLNNISPKIAVYMPYSSYYAEDKVRVFRQTFLTLSKKGTRIYSTGDEDVTVRSTFDTCDLINGTPITINFSDIDVREYIFPNTDLDDILKPGLYYTTGATHSATITNSPYTTGAFRLEVKQIPGETFKGIMQILYPYSTGLKSFYVRVISETNMGTWSLYKDQTPTLITPTAGAKTEIHYNNIYQVGDIVTVMCSIKVNTALAISDVIISGLPVRLGQSYGIFLKAFEMTSHTEYLISIEGSAGTVVARESIPANKEIRFLYTYVAK